MILSARLSSLVLYCLMLTCKTRILWRINIIFQTSAQPHWTARMAKQSVPSVQVVTSLHTGWLLCLWLPVIFGVLGQRSISLPSLSLRRKSTISFGFLRRPSVLYRVFIIIRYAVCLALADSLSLSVWLVCNEETMWLWHIEVARPFSHFTEHHM